MRAVFNAHRQSLCRQMVGQLAAIRDGRDHSAEASRIVGGEGGHYAILIDYDARTDTFGVGYRQRVCAAHTEPVRLFDALAGTACITLEALRC